jgi:phosphoribosylformylglycinamidine synthase subunit PurS
MESAMKARVTVTLKSGILDPQGKAIEGALKSLGVAGVASVRQGKVFDIEIADGDRAGAEATLKEAAEKLLANTVIENYNVEVIGWGSSAMAAVTNELMYEILKQLQSGMAGMKGAWPENTAALNALRTHVMAQNQDIQNIYSILVRHDTRLERIERRLEIVEVG